MAEVVAISLQVDSGNSVNEVKKLEDAIRDVNNSSSTNTLEQKFNTLNTTLESNTATFGEMSQAIEAYKTIALNAGRTSPIGKEALKNASILKDEITDLDREVDNLAQDGRRMQGAMQISQGVMGGYSAFIGITALAGEGNEALEKTLVKLTATMSIMQGIEQIRLATEKESSSMKLLMGIRTKALTAFNWLYVGSVKAGTSALSGMKKALISTGIGAVIVALGTIIAYWDEIKGAVSGLSVEQKNLNKDLEKQKGLTQANLDNLDATEDTLRLQGVTEQEILDRKLKQLDAQLIQQRQTIENAELTRQTQIDASKRNRDIAQGVIRALNLPVIILLKAVDALTYGLEKVGVLSKATNLEKAFSGGLAEMLFDPKETEKRVDATIEEAKIGLDKLQNTRDGFTLKEQAKNKASRDKANAKAIAQQKEFDSEKLALQREFEDLVISSEKDEDVRSLAQLQIKQDRDLQALRDKYGENTELEKQLIINQEAELDALIDEIELAGKEKADAKRIEEAEKLKTLNDEIATAEANTEAEKLEAEYEALDLYYQTLIDKAVLNNLDTAELQKSWNEEKAKNEKKSTDNAIAEAERETLAKESLRADGLKSASSLSNSMASLFSKNEKMQKANALVQIGIDTATAISALVSSSSANPLNATTFGVAGAVHLATGLVSIFGNIAKAKQLLMGGSGGSPTGVTPPSISVPSTDTSTINSQSTNGDGSGGFNIPTNRVVLVESDLRLMQERRDNSDIISTI